MRRRLPLPLVALVAAALCAGRAVAAEPWIAIVVPAGAQHEALHADQLKQIFKRKKLFWDSGARIQPVNLPADHPLRRRFSGAVLRQSPEALQDYWNELYFQGVQPPYVLATEAAVTRFVSDTAQAIGYVSACAVDTQLKVVMLIDDEQKLRPPETAVECAGP